MITIPESLICYRKPAFQAALDRIWETENIPKELMVEDCREFLLAKLSHEKIRADFWCYLHGIWLATWGSALTGAGLEALRIGEHWDEGEEFTLDRVWDLRSLSNLHKLGDTFLLQTFVNSGIKERDDIIIGMTIYRNDTDGSNFPSLSELPLAKSNWEFKEEDEDGDEDNTWYTKPGILTVPTQGPLNVTKLSTIAKAAFTVIQKSIKEPIET